MDGTVPDKPPGELSEHTPMGPPDTGIAYRVKKGVYRFKTHEEADDWWEKVRATSFLLTPEGRGGDRRK